MKILMVELTNHCNEDCWFCPHSKMIREKGFMSMDTVKQVISKIEPGSSVNINNLGESLLHPQFFEIVEMFASAKIGTIITTNACMLDRELVSKLINSSLSSIKISVDFITDDIGELIRPLLCDPRVIVNIKGIDREKIVEFRKRYANKATITFLINYAGQMSFDNDFSADSNCLFLNEDMCIVLWDGRICLCCYDYEGINILGRIEEFDSICPRKDYEICKNCNGFDIRVM